MQAALPDWYFTETTFALPLSTTQEMHRQLIKHTRKRPPFQYHKQLNFQTYPLNDFRFNFKKDDAHKLDLTYITTYKRDFNEYSQTCKRRTSFDKENFPHRLFARKPKFALMPDFSSPNKFMDDEVAVLSKARKDIDFLRQMRNMHHELV